ncbi:hypothetical protein DFQ26_003420 [Actinomortierella ambigua]|nr:hypothetical protein DFQ26_003420 [Actinomortierella ambigua]
MSGFLTYHTVNTTASENAAILKNPEVVYKVTYFQYSHLGAIPRDILAYSGLKWENHKILAGDDWKDRAVSPFHCLPYVEVKLQSDPSKSVMLSESLNVDPFLAGKAGLLGDNEWEEAVIRSIYTNIICLREAFYQNVTAGPSFEGKVAAGEVYAKTTLVKWMAAIEFHLQENARQNPGGYLFGKKISLADIALDNTIDIISQYPEELGKPTLEAIAKSPAICKVIELVDSEPRLQAWRQSDEYTTIVYDSWIRNGTRHGNPAKKDIPFVKAATPAGNRALLVKYGILRRN